MKVAAIQHDIVWQTPRANFEHLAPMIAGAAAGGARLVLLTEMYATGFGIETAAIAEAPGGPSTQFLCEHATRHGCWIGASLPERSAADHTALPYNTFVLAAPDGELHRYNKIHPFSYAHEHEHFASGSAHVIVDIEGLRCALFVCYDLRFADEFWAVAPDVDAYLVPANWPAARRHHWRSLLVARAIENQAYVVGCNRVGTTPGGLVYAGDSMIVDPLGEVLASAAHTETALIAEIDRNAVVNTRARYPFLRDRR
ncbi:MAG TPA: nitrilase-related carbon-nitrogen hydrolase [Acidimicrobiia bacterium]|jgi:predicted amidohydrolase